MSVPAPAREEGGLMLKSGWCDASPAGRVATGGTATTTVAACVPARLLQLVCPA